MEQVDFTKQINNALIKKAKGYTSKEIVEEYVVDEEETKLVKRKITTKDVPPDITAAKVLLDSKNSNLSLCKMTDEELDIEIQKVSKQIEQMGD